MEDNKPYPITCDVWMVPCLISKRNQSYKPVCRPLDKAPKDNSNKCRKSWTEEEDLALSEIAKKTGAKN